MAALRPEKFFALALLILAIPQQTSAVLSGLRLPITVDANSSDFDRKNKRLLFRGVRITQGDLAIAADSAEASQLDFENALWIFRGNVKIELQTALIESDEAKLNFFDHTLSSAIIKGAPAQFEQHVAGEPEPTRGQAGTMEYDFLSGTVKLTEDAWLRRGDDEISGNTLVYNIHEERMIATSDGTEQRVTITITPRDRAQAPAEDGE
jgi:lipopolysaccharide transport protein LptA